MDKQELMLITKRYRCLNCGKKWEKNILTADEVREAQRKGQPVYPVPSPLHCPECGRNTVQEGWD